jgi:hypothetical protein
MEMKREAVVVGLLNAGRGGRHVRAQASGSPSATQLLTCRAPVLSPEQRRENG